jgi:pantetheine-phosphate adenylyltransferase
MKVAIYPGSFNPWHEGHDDVLQKALTIFDKVIVAMGVNPDKQISECQLPSRLLGIPGVQRIKFRGLLVEFIKSNPELDVCAVIRGLRNGQDLEFEKTQMYWNEDLGLLLPTVCFISDRKLSHISSSAIRAVQKASQLEEK